MKASHHLLALSAAFAVAASAALAQTPPARSLANDHPAGLDLAGMDTHVKPGDDFFA